MAGHCHSNRRDGARIGHVGGGDHAGQRHRFRHRVAPTSYSIDVECSSTGSSLPCGGTGGASTITIPLVGTNTVPADMSGWVYTAITLQITPPDSTTPNQTTWTLLPTLTGGNIVSATAPTAASGEASAARRGHRGRPGSVAMAAEVRAGLT